jgi:hypothetical protein
LQKSCLSEKYMSLDKSKDFRCANNAHSYCTEKIKWKFSVLLPISLIFGTPDKPLKSDHLLLPALLPWDKMTELLIPDSFV